MCLLWPSPTAWINREGRELKQSLASALPPHCPLPTKASGSDSSSDGLWYSLRFLFFMGLRSSEALVLELWPEFSTMTDLREEGLREGSTHPAPPSPSLKP